MTDQRAKDTLQTLIHNEVRIFSINPEEPVDFLQEMKEKVELLYSRPDVKRHLINTGEREMKPQERNRDFSKWFKDKTVRKYGIFAKDGIQHIFKSLAYFYPYTEELDNLKPEERSETIEEMIKNEVLNESIVPKTTEGKINYEKIIELGFFLPHNATPNELGTGIKNAIQQLKADKKLPNNTLILFFQLKKQEESMAQSNEHTTESEFEKELKKETQALEIAGFVHKGQIEEGNVGVFAFVI